MNETLSLDLIVRTIEQIDYPKIDRGFPHAFCENVEIDTSSQLSRQNCKSREGEPLTSFLFCKIDKEPSCDYFFPLTSSRPLPSETFSMVCVFLNLQGRTFVGPETCPQGPEPFYDIEEVR